MLDAHHIEEVEMSVFESRPLTPPVLRAEFPLLDEAQLAAAAFLARYRGRTLESYRADLRQFFQWANDVGVTPLTATRAHVELYRAWLDARGLAASTIDRRLSTVCGYYPFAHLRRQDPLQPGPVRPPTPGPILVAAGHGPRRTRQLPVHVGAGLADARRSGRAAGPQRATCQRGLRRQHRGPRLRTRPPHPADR